MTDIRENITQGGHVDDGPRFMYGNHHTYMKYARRMADKLGMSVEDWIMDMEREFDIGGGREDVVDTVSYFPTGDKDSHNHGTDYHASVSSKEAYKLWAARAERIAKISNDVVIVNKLGSEESKKEPVEESILHEKSLGSYKLDKFRLKKYDPRSHTSKIYNHLPTGYRLYDGDIETKLDIHGKALLCNLHYHYKPDEIPTNISSDDINEYQIVRLTLGARHAVGSDRYVRDMDSEVVYRTVADFIAEAYDKYPFGVLISDTLNYNPEPTDKFNHMHGILVNVFNVLEDLLPITTRKNRHTLLVRENREPIVEIGDGSIEPYEFKNTVNNVRKENPFTYYNGGEFDVGLLRYEFIGMGDIKYRVELTYDPKAEPDSASDTGLKVVSTVEIDYTADRSFSKLTNKHEPLKIMSTVMAIVKDAKQRYDFQRIWFDPTWKSKADGEDPIRGRLYMAYIKKAFPNATLSRGGGDDKFFTVDLNEGTESIIEIGDASAKPYDFEVKSDDVDDPFDAYSGMLSYWFMTDSDIDYNVDIEYMEDNTYSDNDDQMVNVSFYTVSPDSDDYDRDFSVVNRGEVFRVMSTVIKIIEDAKRKYDFKIIYYSPNPKDGEGTDSVDNNQRHKLYMAYMKRLFPNAQVHNVRNAVSIFLNEGIVTDNISGDDLSDIEIREEQNPTVENDDLVQSEDMIIDPDDVRDTDDEDEPSVTTFNPVEGGYKKYIRTNYESLGLDTMIGMWDGELRETYTDITDSQVDFLIESNLIGILGEKSYKDLRRDAPNYLRTRDKSRKTPGSKFQSINDKNICHFKTPSHTKPGVVYDEWVRLVDLEELIQKFSGTKKPLEIIRMALEGNIEIHCTCPAWKYWGFQHIGTRDDYAIEKEPRFPKVRNPQLLGSVCKHLDNVLFILPFQNTKIYKDLRQQQRL